MLDSGKEPWNMSILQNRDRLKCCGGRASYCVRIREWVYCLPVYERASDGYEDVLGASR